MTMVFKIEVGLTNDTRILQPNVSKDRPTTRVTRITNQILLWSILFVPYIFEHYYPTWIARTHWDGGLISQWNIEATYYLGAWDISDCYDRFLIVIPVMVGCFVHLWLDDLSRICWWYPISGHRTTAVLVSEKFHLWIYRTGQPKQYVFVTLLVVTALLMLYLKYPFLN